MSENKERKINDLSFLLSFRDSIEHSFYYNLFPDFNKSIINSQILKDPKIYPHILGGIINGIFKITENYEKKLSLLKILKSIYFRVIEDIESKFDMAYFLPEGVFASPNGEFDNPKVKIINFKISEKERDIIIIKNNRYQLNSIVIKNSQYIITFFFLRNIGKILEVIEDKAIV